MKIARKELKEIEAEAREHFTPEVIDYHGREWLLIETIYGPYRFYFDYDGEGSIFGRFTDTDKLRAGLPPREETLKGVCYRLVYYPTLPSGKFNFHFEQCYDFINTIEGMVKCTN